MSFKNNSCFHDLEALSTTLLIQIGNNIFLYKRPAGVIHMYIHLFWALPGTPLAYIHLPRLIDADIQINKVEKM